MNDADIVAYTNNGIPLCLKCVERFDLTSPNERDPEDEFLPVTWELMKANIEINHKVWCGGVTCWNGWDLSGETNGK